MDVNENTILDLTNFNLFANKIQPKKIKQEWKKKDKQRFFHHCILLLSKEIYEKRYEDDKVLHPFLLPDFFPQDVWLLD